MLIFLISFFCFIWQLSVLKTLQYLQIDFGIVETVFFLISSFSLGPVGGFVNKKIFNIRSAAICIFLGQIFFYFFVILFHRWAIYLTILFSLFGYGLAVAHLLFFSRSGSRISLYAYDLIGALVGLLAFAFLVNYIGVEIWLFSCLIFSLFLCYLYASLSTRVIFTLPCILLTGYLLQYDFNFAFARKGAVSFDEIHRSADRRYSGRIQKGELEHLFTGWSLLERVDIGKTAGAPTYFVIAFNDLIWTGFQNFNDPLTYSRPIIENTTGKVLIVGSGGGKDVYSAMQNRDPSNIFAFDISKTLIHAMKERFHKETADIYNKINIYTTDARFFWKQLDEKFSLIYHRGPTITREALLGSVGDNNSHLFSKDTLGRFIDSLNDDGVLVINHWEKHDRNYNYFFEAFVVTFLNLLDERNLDADRHLRVFIEESKRKYTRTVSFLFSKSRDTNWAELTKNTRFKPLYPQGYNNLNDTLNGYADAIREKFIPLSRLKSTFEITDNFPFQSRSVARKRFFYTLLSFIVLTGTVSCMVFFLGSFSSVRESCGTTLLPLLSGLIFSVSQITFYKLFGYFIAHPVSSYILVTGLYLLSSIFSVLYVGKIFTYKSSRNRVMLLAPLVFAMAILSWYFLQTQSHSILWIVLLALPMLVFNAMLSWVFIYFVQNIEGGKAVVSYFANLSGCLFAYVIYKGVSVFWGMSAYYMASCVTVFFATAAVYLAISEHLDTERSH